MIFIYYAIINEPEHTYLAWGYKYKKHIHYLNNNGEYHDYKQKKNSTIKSLISDLKKDKDNYEIIYESNSEE